MLNLRKITEIVHYQNAQSNIVRLAKQFSMVNCKFKDNAQLNFNLSIISLYMYLNVTGHSRRAEIWTL